MTETELSVLKKAGNRWRLKEQQEQAQMVGEEESESSAWRALGQKDPAEGGRGGRRVPTAAGWKRGLAAGAAGCWHPGREAAAFPEREALTFPVT